MEIAQYKVLQDLQRRHIDPNSPFGQTSMATSADNVRRQQGATRAGLLNLVPDSGTRMGTQAATNVLTNPSDPSNLVKQQQAAYAEIDKLRQQDVLSEQQAALAKAQVDDEITQKRLQGAVGYFGALAALSKSSNKELAAIGKAAALAQATISAYSAINKAWDSAPFPANLPAVAIVTVQTFANIAAIEGFATGVIGLQGPGTGTSDSIPAWLSKGESVVTASGTQGNQNTLAAMNMGGKFDGAGSGGAKVQITVENHTDAGVQVRQIGPSEVRIIVRDEISKATPGIVGQAINTTAQMAPAMVAKANKNPRRRGAA
jgi:hypothetical protein